MSEVQVQVHCLRYRYIVWGTTTGILSEVQVQVQVQVPVSSRPQKLNWLESSQSANIGPLRYIVTELRDLKNIICNLLRDDDWILRIIRIEWDKMTGYDNNRARDG